MADRYCVTTSYWSKLESGSGACPSATLAKLIAVGESVTLDWLLAGEGDGPVDLQRPRGSVYEIPEERSRESVREAIEMTYRLLHQEDVQAAIAAVAKVAEGSEVATLVSIVEQAIQNRK